MLDSATTWFGITIENALAERVKVKMGSEVHYNPKYSLARLLHQDYRLPLPPQEKTDTNPWASLMAWAGRSNKVKRYAYVAPPEKAEEVEVADG